MATVLLPASLIALFPGTAKRHEVAGESVGAVIDALDRVRAGRPRPVARGRAAAAAAHQRLRRWPAGRPDDRGRCRGRRPRPARGKWRVSRGYVPVHGSSPSSADVETSNRAHEPAAEQARDTPAPDRQRGGVPGAEPARADVARPDRSGRADLGGRGRRHPAGLRARPAVHLRGGAAGPRGRATRA